MSQETTFRCITWSEYEDSEVLYHGFATRDFLVVGHSGLNENASVLEIGVGTASTAQRIIGRVKKFCGVDISRPLIEFLAEVYKDDSSVRMVSMDVCNGVSLGEQFDFIYSLDTLEHVKYPKGYFDFISRHLADDGFALVTYPNESERKHHGITRFNTKTELIELIDESGLVVSGFCEVKKRMWHCLVEKLLWKVPKSLVSQNVSSPQTFEQTASFQIILSGSVKARVIAYYARLVVRLAATFPLFSFFEVDEDIRDKMLLFHLKHK